MLKYGVSNYELVTVVKKGEIVKTIEDIMTMPNVYHLVTKEGVSILKKKNEQTGEVKKEITYTLPSTDINHTVISVKKLRQTPAIYPRKAGKPSKAPLK